MNSTGSSNCSGWAIRSRALAAFLLVASVGCGPSQPPPTTPDPLPPFDAGAALEDAENLSALVSRPSGSIPNRQAAAYIQARLRAAGLDPVVDTFTNRTAAGEVVFRTIEVVRPGHADDIVIISTHYDSMHGMPGDFAAANAAGSGPGVVLELARQFAGWRAEQVPELRFVFFDGQEPFVQHGAGDGLRGSTRYAGRLVANGERHRVRAVINLNLVGDRDLTITIPRNVDPGLRQRLLDAAHAEHARRRFALFPAGIGDDHDPFLERGMPAINIIDFEYGSASGRNDYWRTPADTPDKLARESLDVIGRVTIRLVHGLFPPR